MFYGRCQPPVDFTISAFKARLRRLANVTDGDRLLKFLMDSICVAAGACGTERKLVFVSVSHSLPLVPGESLNSAQCKALIDSDIDAPCVKHLSLEQLSRICEAYTDFVSMVVCE